MSELELFGTDGIRGVANRDPMMVEVAVALGRAKQVNKAGLATKLFERLKAIKAAKGKG